MIHGLTSLCGGLSHRDLSLERSSRQPSDDITLQQQKDHDNRQAARETCRHKLPPVYITARFACRHVRLQADGERPRSRIGQYAGEQGIAPGRTSPQASRKENTKVTTIPGTAWGKTM